MPQDRGIEHFGGRLKTARERRGITLRQIATATKISVGVLEALERNDFSRLPGGIFSRAFIRSYASEVGLDPEETIQDFLSQLPAGSGTALSHAAQPIEDSAAIESSRAAAAALVRLVAISLPVLAIVLYVGYRMTRPVAPQRAATSSSVEMVPPPVPPASASKPSSSPAAAAASTGPIDPAADRVTISLTTSRACSLSLIVDGERAPQRLFRPGERQTVEIRRELVVTADDAAAIVMTVNGIAARPLGRTGELVTARVTPSNFRQFLADR